MKHNFVDEKYRSAVIVFFHSIKYRFRSFSHSTQSLAFYGTPTSQILQFISSGYRIFKIARTERNIYFWGSVFEIRDRR